MTYIGQITGVINTLVAFSLVIVGAVFVYGAVIFVLGSGDEKKREKGRDIMIYTLIGGVLILSLWGIFAIVNASIGAGAGGGRPTTVPGF